MIYKSISWIAVVLWMAFIFYLSAQVAEQSNNVSTGITEIIIEVVETVVPEKELDIKTVNHFVRKNAHFFTYFMLGILVVNALAASGVKGFKGIAIAFLICVLYAVSDEVHQLYVPGRGCQITDVLIDSGGALAGISLFTLLRRIFIRWRHRDMSVGCKI